MAQKQSILGRITQLAKANINALLDGVEDPEKMLDQLIRDYTNSISDAETAVAQAIGNLRLSEKDREADLNAAADWGKKASLASSKADSLRPTGKPDEADNLDNLARIALGKQIDAEKAAATAEPSIALQTQTVDQLKTGLEQMKAKLIEVKTKRDELVARSKTAAAQARVQQAVSAINMLDPTSELARFEERVRREEAMAAGQIELATPVDTLESQFAELGQYGKDSEVATRLAALKEQS